jgi:hypothetical protein
MVVLIHSAYAILQNITVRNPTQVNTAILVRRNDPLLRYVITGSDHHDTLD